MRGRTSRAALSNRGGHRRAFGPGLEQLAYRLDELFAYLESNHGARRSPTVSTLVREHKPISFDGHGGIAVNQGVQCTMWQSQHIAGRQWRPSACPGASAVINGDLAPGLRPIEPHRTKYPRTCSAFSSSCSGSQNGPHACVTVPSRLSTLVSNSYHVPTLPSF